MEFDHLNFFHKNTISLVTGDNITCTKIYNQNSIKVKPLWEQEIERISLDYNILELKVSREPGYIF